MRETKTAGGPERLPFKQIGNYRLIDKLGAGGMGEVYLGVEEPVGRKVAIKLMHAGLEKKCLQRFNDERKALASLNQRNIVTMLTSGEAYNRHYLVMEYLEGESLRERLLRGPMAPSEVVEITRQICDALNAAHRREIVHRDIKPDNIFLTHDDDGRLVKVLDFGIATLKESETRTMTGGLIGTGPYLSPEQSRGVSRREIDGRVDIYALGLVVYEMLTGVRAFTAKDLPSYQHLHLNVMPPRPSERMPGTGSDAINEVVMKALAKDPSQRHQTAREFARELQAAVERSAVPAPREIPVDGRVQMLNAFVEGPTGSKPSETVGGGPVPTTTSDVRRVTERARGWRSRSILPLTISSLLLLIGGGWWWWLYTSLVSSSRAPIVDNSSKGGLGGQPAMSGAGNQSPFPGRTGTPEVKSPAGSGPLVNPATTADGAVERRPIADGTNTHNPIVASGKESQAADDSRLIGRWRAEIVEFGPRTTIILQVNPDGTMNYLFYNSHGVSKSTSRWRLSDGILYEQSQRGSASGKIRWIDDDHFEATIIHNQNSGSAGFKRQYSRMF